MKALEQAVGVDRRFCRNDASGRAHLEGNVPGGKACGVHERVDMIPAVQ